MTPAGTHLATCYRVIDMGTQNISFNGENKRQHKIMLSWELPEELMEDGRPFTVHKTYTLSSHEKSTLRIHLESWRGQPFTEEELGKFDVGTLIGVPALIGIVHTHKDGKTYSNIGSISRLMKGMQAKPLINEPVHLDLSKFDHEVYAKLSDGLRQKIGDSPEYYEATQAPREEEYAA